MGNHVQSIEDAVDVNAPQVTGHIDQLVQVFRMLDGLDAGLRL